MPNYDQLSPSDKTHAVIHGIAGGIAILLGLCILIPLLVAIPVLYWTGHWVAASIILAIVAGGVGKAIGELDEGRDSYYGHCDSWGYAGKPKPKVKREDRDITPNLTV